MLADILGGTTEGCDYPTLLIYFCKGIADTFTSQGQKNVIGIIW